LKKLDFVIQKFSAGIDALAGIILCLMALLVTTAVVLRYGFGVSFQWVEEVALYGQIAIVMLIAGPLLYKVAHIKVDVVYRRLKGIPLWVIDIVNTAICLYVIYSTFNESIGWVQRMKNRGVLTNSGIFEQWMPSMLIPIGFGIATALTILLLAKTIMRFKDTFSKNQNLENQA